MKTIYKVLYPLGFTETNVSIDYETAVPYTEVEPLKIEGDQYFDFGSNQWKEAVTQDNRAKVEMLESFHVASTEKLAALEAQTQKQDEEITNTQLAVAEVFELMSEVM